MYSIKNVDSKESNTGKGVNIATEFTEFKDTLFNKKVLRHKMRRIKSKKHKLGTYEIEKISLSCFDDKRFILIMVFIRVLIFTKVMYIIYIYIYIRTLRVLFIVAMSQHIHTLVTLASHSNNLFQLVLLDHCHYCH